MARILHIGGGAGQQALVRRLLEDDGHGVVSTDDPRDGVAIALREKPQLILLDMETTGVDGYEVAARLRGRAELEGIPIVTLSEPEDRDLALSIGCDGCLDKPLDPTRFPKRIRAFLRGKRERIRGAVQRRTLQAYSRSLVEKLEHKVVELTIANQRLRQADELKNRVFENVSSELATPLTPLLGYLSLLDSGRLGPLNRRQRRAVTAVHQQVRRLTRTVDHLIDLASLQDAGMPVQRIEVDACQVARDARLAVGAAARSRRIQLDLHLPPEALPVRVDEARLRQAVVRLLDNALRFTPRGGYVLVEVVGEDRHVTVSVYDSGEVVPGELQGQAFEPFATPGRQSADGIPRPDLGLALARRVAEAHGGTTTIESPPDRTLTAPTTTPGSR